MAKPKVGFQVEPEDKQALEAVTQLVRRSLPALGDQSGSVVLRAALRFGLAELLRNPASAATAVPPDVRPLLDRWAEEAHAAEDAAHTKELLADEEDGGPAQPRRGRGRPPKAPKA